jgi:transposase InsO family protein
MTERRKARRNLVRPRFFERATPNQMWQTDIFTFRLGGKYAYAVAFMDDYSRYVVNLELYRSPTAECVVETYRVAAGEYNPPKEMLTDRGPQYFNWRGKSRFASELTKDRVAHLVSRPQHPMTLGKVERFWATMWQEFLVRAQFDSFESARERLAVPGGPLLRDPGGNEEADPDGHPGEPARDGVKGAAEGALLSGGTDGGPVGGPEGGEGKTKTQRG